MRISTQNHQNRIEKKMVRVGRSNGGNTPALNRCEKLSNTMLRYAITQYREKNLFFFNNQIKKNELIQISNRRNKFMRL